MWKWGSEMGVVKIPSSSGRLPGTGGFERVVLTWSCVGAESDAHGMTTGLVELSGELREVISNPTTTSDDAWTFRLRDATDNSVDFLAGQYVQRSLGSSVVYTEPTISDVVNRSPIIAGEVSVQVSDVGAGASGEFILMFKS